MTAQRLLCDCKCNQSVYSLTHRPPMQSPCTPCRVARGQRHHETQPSHSEQIHLPSCRKFPVSTILWMMSRGLLYDHKCDRSMYSFTRCPLMPLPCTPHQVVQGQRHHLTQPSHREQFHLPSCRKFMCQQYELWRMARGLPCNCKCNQSVCIHLLAIFRCRRFAPHAE